MLFESDLFADFGFSKVKHTQKSSLVKGVFDHVAGKYDIMNDAMSLGLHRCWKNKMVSYVNPIAEFNLLDLAGGTGDIAFRIYIKMQKAELPFSIVVADINQEMLSVGQSRAIDNNIISNIIWEVADGENLPFSDNHFDYLTIAYGIRNFTNIQKGLEEIYRVLKPGGAFLCLEFSALPEKSMFKNFYEFYSFNVIPYMGKLVTKDASPYKYLVESIKKFPAPDVFTDMIKTVGFAYAKYESLSFGVTTLYRAWKAKE